MKFLCKCAGRLHTPQGLETTKCGFPRFEALLELTSCNRAKGAVIVARSKLGSLAPCALTGLGLSDQRTELLITIDVVEIAVGIR